MTNTVKLIKRATPVRNCLLVASIVTNLFLTGGLYMFISGYVVNNSTTTQEVALYDPLDDIIAAKQLSKR